MNSLLVSILLLAAAAGKAPSPEEQRLFDEGMRAYQAGDARAADKAWRAGYQLGKDPAFLVRMGEAEEKAGQTAEAGDSYRRYLHAAPDASDRAEIEQRLVRLGPAGAAPGAAGPVPTDAHEVPGAFGDTGPAPAGVSPGSLPLPLAPAPPPRLTSDRARDDEIARGSGSGAEPSGWGPLNITAWVATGATVVLLGVSGYFAASAASNKDDVNLLLRFQNPDTGEPLDYQTVAARYEKATRDGQHNDRLAKGALIAAGGTAVVATVFFILDSVRGPDATPVERGQAGTDRAPRLGLGVSPPAGDGPVTAFSTLRWSF
jgi:hypothetical protein